MVPPTLADWELLARWRGGESRAGSQLLARYFDPLTALFRNKVASDEDVSDLVSDTLLACVHARDRIEHDEKFSPYLYGIALRQLRQYYRKRSKRRRERADFAELCVADLAGQPSPASLLGLEQEARLLLHGLRAIRLDYQIVLELYFFEGLKGREIGELLGIPGPTVHTRLRRGRAQLSEAIAQLSSSPERLRTTLSGLQTWARELREVYLRPNALEQA